MSTFDKDLKEGDIVISLWKKKGFWRVLSVEDNIIHGRPYSSYINVELVMSAEGVEPKKTAKKDRFCANWLTKMDVEAIEKSMAYDIDKWNKLLNFVKAKDEESEEEGEGSAIFKILESEILSLLGPPESLFSENK